MRSRSKRITRAFRRRGTHIPVALMSSGQRWGGQCSASIMQTSFLGMRVQTPLALKRGELVRIVRMTGAFMPVPARVVWVGAAKSDKQRYVGLIFTDPLHARISPS
jgi:hypothetical protein